MLDRRRTCELAVEHPVKSGEPTEASLVGRIVREVELGDASRGRELEALGRGLGGVLHDDEGIDALGDEVLHSRELLGRGALPDHVEDLPSSLGGQGIEDLEAGLVIIIRRIHVITDDLLFLGNAHRHAQCEHSQNNHESFHCAFPPFD